MSKQRTRKFVTKILRKTCSSLVKIISDGENNFTQNKYNKLQKISAKVQIWDHLYSSITWWRKYWRVFHDWLLLRRCFQGCALPILEYCSAVWCLGADTPFKLLDRAVSSGRFLIGGVFECDIAHRRSVSVLCMLYKIRCNTMHSLNGALPGPRLPMRVTRGALVAHRILMRRLAAEHRSTAGLLFPSQWPSGTILLTLYSMVWDY